MAGWIREKFSYFHGCFNQTLDQHLGPNDLLKVAEAFRVAHGWAADDERHQLIEQHLEEFFLVLRQCADTTGVGVVSREEFVNFMIVMGDLTQRSDGKLPPWAKGLVNTLLGSMDRDGDGRVSLQEYQEYLIAIGSQMDGESAFSELDLDNSGFIEVEELDVLMAQYLGSDNQQDAGNYLLTGGWLD